MVNRFLCSFVAIWILFGLSVIRRKKYLNFLNIVLDRIVYICIIDMRTNVADTKVNIVLATGHNVLTSLAKNLKSVIVAPDFATAILETEIR
jgi:hypothetical protein